MGSIPPNVGTEGRIVKRSGAVVPPEVVTTMLRGPGGVPDAMTRSAVAVLVFTTWILLAVIPVAVMVIGSEKLVPVSVTETEVPTTPLDGSMAVNVGGEDWAADGNTATSNRHVVRMDSKAFLLMIIRKRRHEYDAVAC